MAEKLLNKYENGEEMDLMALLKKTLIFESPKTAKKILKFDV